MARVIDFFPDVSLAHLIADSLGKMISDETSEEELGTLEEIGNTVGRGICSIEGIQFLTGVLQFDFEGNEICHFPFFVHQMAAEALYFSHNRFIVFPTFNPDCFPHLLIMDFDYNDIQVFPNFKIRHFPSLRYLMLRHNQICTFPQMEAEDFCHLKELNLEFNRLKQLNLSDVSALNCVLVEEQKE